MLPNDFPEWFACFLKEQLSQVPTFNEQPSYDIDNLAIAYIKLWSVFEIYIKVLVKLHQKRGALKEVDAKIKQAERIIENANNWVASAKELSDSYSASIRSGTVIDVDKNLGKFSSQIKATSVSKYTMRKSDIVLMSLPNAKEIEKASAEFQLDCLELSNLLRPTNSESKFYKTRNTIAHEGKSDIQLRNFIIKRIIPLKKVVDIIKNYVEVT